MEDVREIYNQYTQREWERLERHRTEFAVSLRVLEEHLPQPPAEILDLGSGPGRYALALAREGYAVTLADVSERSLELAEEKAALEGLNFSLAVLADARDLEGLADGHFEAVMMMGPLYHLITAEGRLLAINEASRVLKPDGKIFAAFVTRFAPFRDSAANYPEWLFDENEYALEVLGSGIHYTPKNLAPMYLAHPDEIEPLMEKGGFETLEMVGVEGVVAGHEERVNQLQGEAWQVWVDLNYRLGKEPTLRGAADHLLYVGKKILKGAD